MAAFKLENRNVMGSIVLFSYSFEPNADWRQKYSSQPEIQEYLERVAYKYDIGKHVDFGKRVMKTTWNGENE